MISIDPRIIYSDTMQGDTKLQIPFGALRYAEIEDDIPAECEIFREEVLALKRKIEANYKVFLQEVFEEETFVEKCYDLAFNQLYLSSFPETFYSMFTKSYFDHLYVPDNYIQITFKDSRKEILSGIGSNKMKEAYATISELRLEHKVLTTIAMRPELLSIVIAGRNHTDFLSKVLQRMGFVCKVDCNESSNLATISLKDELKVVGAKKKKSREMKQAMLSVIRSPLAYLLRKIEKEDSST